MQLIKACKELLIRSPFYGLFLLNLRKEIVYDNSITSTAAVGPNGINFTLYINDNFWKTLTDLEQLALLQHELCHLCFFHLTDDFKAENYYNMNIANDCHVNQYIPNLPAGAITLQKLSQTLGKPLEEKRGSWYYYKEIQDFAQKHPEQCMSNGSLADISEIDDHSLWPKDMPTATKTLLENQIKSKLKETAEIVDKQAEKVPGELGEILKKIQDKPPVFNWKRYLRRVIGNAITSEIQLTRLRPSKRIPDSKGVRFKRKPKILVGVDTSGSINMKDFEDFFSEINHIYKTGTSVTVVECDTKIQNIFEYQGSQDIKINGRGGTMLKPIVDYYKEHKEYSACVVFTDGYCETEMPFCKNLIWIITSDGNKSQKFSPGQVILIP